MASKKELLGFDTDKYLNSQINKIKEMVGRADGKLYIEFGGKLIQDKHSSRVLPGYREDAKLEILKKICGNGGVILAVSSKDIDRGRIRGDFKTTYDKETLRTISELKKRGLAVYHVAITLLQRNKLVSEKILSFEKELLQRKIHVYRFYEIDNYPTENISIDDLKVNSFIKINKKIVSIISPGGGSGKFGVCLSQLYHEILNSVTPRYLKFETFPVHDLKINHPLNLAYMAASADFYDVVMKDKRDGKATSYNRDIENYELLHLLASKFPNQGKYLRRITSATNMGINMISKGIIDDEIVQREAAAEIARRYVRYKFEVLEGKEDKKVLLRVKSILKML